MQKVVKVGDIRDPDAARSHCGLHAERPRAVERPPQVQRICDRIQHCFGRYIRLRWMHRGRKLDAIDAEIPSEAEPILDSPIRIRIADLSRRELLKSRCQ